jgi:hypothetical protein
MSEKIQRKGCIYKLNSRYNVKMEGYTNSGLDIPTLDKIDYAYMRNYIHLIIHLQKSCDINTYSGVVLLW